LIINYGYIIIKLRSMITTTINDIETKYATFDEIENCENITKIDCSNNKLIKLPNLSRFINLKKLWCNINLLSELDDSIFCLTNLEELNCSYNRLCSLSENIGNLTKLTYLHCDSNYVASLLNKVNKLLVCIL
jgi:Leucine-rich repeat (LRR) protein